MGLGDGEMMRLGPGVGGVGGGTTGTLGVGDGGTVGVGAGRLVDGLGRVLVVVGTGVAVKVDFTPTSWPPFVGSGKAATGTPCRTCAMESVHTRTGRVPPVTSLPAPANGRSFDWGYTGGLPTGLPIRYMATTVA